MSVISIASAKLSSFIVKQLKLGSGSALPGRVALQFNPKLIAKFNEQLKTGDNTYMITGTNGKTTTTGILKNISHLNNKKLGRNPYVICNDMGANLYYGICSELVHSSHLNGELKSKDFCLEVDEASLEKLCKDLFTKNICVTNIFRDQLDRYGELDSTLKMIADGINQNLESMSAHDPKAKLNITVNAFDKRLANLCDLIDKKHNFEIFYYGVYDEDDSKSELDDIDKIKDPVEDRSLDFIAKIKKKGIDGAKLSLITKNDKVEVEVKLPGLYNIYNATAAAATAYFNGVSLEMIKEGVETYHNNFGRSEKKVLNNHGYQVFLIKNPTGASEVLKHLSQNDKADFLIAINDNYADGRDVSWLWDAKFEHLAGVDRNFLCSGKRAEDMALRLKYAGIKAENISITKDLNKALNDLTKNTASERDIYVLPTYTCLLELKKM